LAQALASSEAGLPTGAGLIPILRNKLNFKHEMGVRQVSGDPGLFEALRRNAALTSQDVNLYAQAGRRIFSGLPLASSIDDFLDMHRGDGFIQACGKLAVVQAILEAERASKLFFDNRKLQSLDIETIAQTWYVQFMRILRQGVSKQEAGRLFENVSFVSFNYDRCIEQFLFQAVQLAYGFDPATARQLCRTLNVCHPYGSVGLSPDLPQPHSPGDVPFGADAYDLVALANNIKTYTEQAHSEEWKKIKVAMKDAETVVFLGFAFHPQNMQLLSTDGDTRIRNVYATAKGISASDVMVTERLIRTMLGSRSSSVSREDVRIVDTSCNDLFKEYWRSLALS
jgi:hypothetical protein